VFGSIAIIIKGGPVMVPLLACSIISLAVVIERIIFWRKAQSREPVEELLQLVERGGLLKPQSWAERSTCPPHGS
jgi:biopolymer transport protein ExbB